MTTNPASKRIESLRDLEDFVPLKIKLGTQEIGPNYTVQITSVGVGVNLFRGVWNDEDEEKAHEYMHSSQQAKMQVETANKPGGHVGYLRPGTEMRLEGDRIAELFDARGEGRFLLEGTHPSQSNCSSTPNACYLTVSIHNETDSTIVAESKVFLDLHDVKDFYQHITAGSAEPWSIGDFDAEYLGPDAIMEVHPITMDIYRGEAEDEDIFSYAPNTHYILFVHGWRMLDFEKISFAETAFKRLYWSGYKGRFGTITWPTGWFNKPAYVYGGAQAAFLIGNTDHYDKSEAVARQVGRDLAVWLGDHAPELPGVHKHLIAHSMGNVVVSEMLRHSTAPVFESYAPSMAASVAGAYDSEVGYYQHNLYLTNYLQEGCEAKDPDDPDDTTPPKSPEESWRCYNMNAKTDYDMPPDMYRSDFVVRNAAGEAVPDSAGHLVVHHGPTTDLAMAQPVGKTYYDGLKNKLSQNGRIMNFFNSGDTALSGWEFNQLTKPDNGAISSWSYGNDVLDYVGELPPPDPDSVDSKFFKRSGLAWIPYYWSEQVTEESAGILGHIVPARTQALGQMQIINSDLGFDSDNSRFTSSNQDHSAPFHGYYTEISSQAIRGPVRARYWNEVLRRSIVLPDVEYSGLKNNLGLTGEAQ